MQADQRELCECGPKIEKVDGEFWVDSGRADVGPFTTIEEAEESIRRMASAREEPMDGQLELLLTWYREKHH